MTPDTVIRFGEPIWLTLLAAPGVLLVVWIWQLWRRRADARRFRQTATRVSFAGDLPFWLAILLAVASTILALARPMTVTSRVRTGGVDLVILQDGSASMRVRDAGTAGTAQSDRWARSMQFLRTLGESLRWERDRMALAVFAGMATPQIRLTRDPNTFFFFLDHLGTEPPFRLKDAGTWDTNIERGIYWGMRLIEKDEEILGPSENGRAFVLLSDGQAWSGRVEQSLGRVRERSIPLYVVGVGTTAGGVIPEPDRASGLMPVSSNLDRESLSIIATAGGGRYFELGRESDTTIANTIIAAARARAPINPIVEGTTELYRRFLAGAAALLVLGLVFVRDSTALALHISSAGAVLIWMMLR